MNACKICNNSEGNAVYTAKEMLHGTREKFQYMECGSCGCLQLLEVPQNLSRYYPHDYFSFSSRKRNAKRHRWNPRRLVKLWWKRTYFQRKCGPLGRALLSLKGKPALPEWMITTGIDPDSNILDIGCGDGNRLLQLKELGFKNLRGIDQFADYSNIPHSGVKLSRASIYDLKENSTAYDLIMLHHSFEHMERPLNVLSQIRTMLNDDGSIVIVIPIKDSYAWEMYGTDWFALDAPRHFFLHSRASMELLVEKSGLVLIDAYCDSSSESLWGSEQYRMDIPMNDIRSFKQGIESSPFAAQDIERFKTKARELDMSGLGDIVCFVIKKRVGENMKPNRPLQ